MAERTAILIDSKGEFLGTASNPLYVGGFTAVGSFTELTDVNWTNPASGDYVGWDEATQTFIPKPVSGSGLGDVTGPTGATDRAVAIYDDTTGKVIGYTPVTIDTSNRLDMHGNRVLNVGVPDVSTDAANKGYVDQFVQGVSWQAPVVSIETASPANPEDGARYIIGDNPSGDWIGHSDSIATWYESAGVWGYSEPDDGWAAYNEDTGTIWVYNLGTLKWVDIGTSGVPEAPNNANTYGRSATTWKQVFDVFEYNAASDAIPKVSGGLTDIYQLGSAVGQTTSPLETVWPEIQVYYGGAGSVTLCSSSGGSFWIDDTLDLVTPKGTLTLSGAAPGQQGTISPQNVTSYFNIGWNTVHLKTYSLLPAHYGTDAIYLYVTPGLAVNVVPRVTEKGTIGKNGTRWEAVFAKTIYADAYYANGHSLSAADIGASALGHVHAIATTVASGFMPQLNSNVASFLAGDGTWRSPVGVPAAHATSHVTGGSDVIAAAVAGGNSGLMSGADKTKLDGLSNYTLPTASATVLGGVKVGTNLSIDGNGVLSATGGASTGGQFLVQRTIEGVVYETSLPYWIVPASCTVASADMALISSPGATSTYCRVQIMKNSVLETSSIFGADQAMVVSDSTPANNGVYFGWSALDPASVALAKGDVIHFRVNEAAIGSAGLLVQLRCTIN